MPRIFGALAPPRDAERLARVSRSDEIHDSTPRASVEGSQVRPDRERSDSTRRRRSRQVDAGAGIPFHPADDASARHCQLDSEIEPASSGAE